MPVRVFHQYNTVKSQISPQSGQGLKIGTGSKEVSILPKISQRKELMPHDDHQLTMRRVKKYGLNMLGMLDQIRRNVFLLTAEVSSDDQVKAYIKKIMSQLNKWMTHGKISKLVVVITSKETGEHVERWQFDVQLFNKSSKQRSTRKAVDKENTAPE